MRIGRAFGCSAIVLMCLALCACGHAGVPSASNSMPATPSTVASQFPLRTSAPTFTPLPTPPPTPTPTPDPWADKFHTGGGAYIHVKDFANGPWIYKDADLSVEIRYLRGGPRKNSYYRAEIYSRGVLFRRGLSFGTINKPGSGKTELPYKIARRYDAVLGITADYYNIKYNPRGVILIGDISYWDKGKNTTLAILPDGNLKAYEPGAITAAQLKRMGVKDTFSFGPILVNDGAIDTDSIKRHWLSSADMSFRAAIGQVEPGHYIAIVTKGPFTMSELAQLFIENHCTMAYNLDGGHSASMIFMGEQLNTVYEDEFGYRQRTLPDLLMIGSNAVVPDVKAKVYSNGVDLFPKNKPKPTDGVIP